MVTPLCPLCTAVSQVNSLIAQTLCQTKLCMDVTHILKLWPFSDIFANFGQHLVAMVTSLWPLQSEMCSLDWPTMKPLLQVGPNHILPISRRNGLICIYSNFSPKIVCHGNAPLSLVYRSVTEEFPDGANPISKPNSAWMCRLLLTLWPFCNIFAYFGQNLVTMTTFLRHLESDMLYLDWWTHKTVP